MALDPSIFIPAGAWLWEQYREKVMAWLGQRFGGKLAELAQQGWQSVDWSGAAKIYHSEMLRQHGKMRILGMAEPIPLQNIFTDVMLLDKPSAWKRHSIELLQQSNMLDPDGNNSIDNRRDAIELIQRSRKTYILGKPGAGKTTLLKYLVLQTIIGEFDAIPIFIGLKAWADSKLELITGLLQNGVGAGLARSGRMRASGRGRTAKRRAGCQPSSSTQIWCIVGGNRFGQGVVKS